MPTTVSPQPPQTPPTPPKNWSKRRGKGGLPWRAPWKHPRPGCGQDATLGGQPGSQSLIGESLRRPAWVPEPYWGKPQEASLGPRALWGEASGGQPRALLGKALAGHPGSQSLMGGSVRRPPWIPEPNGGKPLVATLDPRAL